MEHDAPVRRPPIHKRRYIVDRPFQFRLIGTFLALWVANSLFFSLVLYFFYQGHLMRFYDLTPRPGAFPLVSLPVLFATAVGFVFVFGFVGFGIIALYMSNQIAGPLFRTRKVFDQVGEGDLRPGLQFRQRDFLQDFSLSVNAMVERLRQRVENDIEELKAVESASHDPALVRRLVRRQRERKEAELGVSGREAKGPADPKPVSVSIH